MRSPVSSNPKNSPESRAEHLKRISQSLLNLPTLPTLAARLLDLVDNPNTNAVNLAQFISQDQVITARLLKMCNSSYYGLGREVASVHQAVVLLGFDMVREVSLSVSVINAFKSAKSLEGFDISGFWDHSSAVGLVARKIAKGFVPQYASEALTAGLLHDIGKVVLIQYLPEEFSQTLQTARQQNRQLAEVELEVFGTDHGQIGSWLAERWKLPKTIRDVMACHHKLDQAPPESKDLVGIVQMSDLVCRLLRAGDGGNPAPPQIGPELQILMENWGMSPTIEGLKPLLASLVDELQQMTSFRTDLVG